MATIRSTCPEHNFKDTETTTKDVNIVVFTDNANEPLDRLDASYRFTCDVGERNHTVLRPGEPRTIQLLLASGCEVIYIKHPRDNLKDAPSPLDKDLIYDEIIDIHILPDATVYNGIASLQP